MTVVHEAMAAITDQADDAAWTVLIEAIRQHTFQVSLSPTNDSILLATLDSDPGTTVMEVFTDMEQYLAVHPAISMERCVHPLPGGTCLKVAAEGGYPLVLDPGGSRVVVPQRLVEEACFHRPKVLKSSEPSASESSSHRFRFTVRGQDRRILADRPVDVIACLIFDDGPATWPLRLQDFADEYHAYTTELRKTIQTDRIAAAKAEGIWDGLTDEVRQQCEASAAGELPVGEVSFGDDADVDPTAPRFIWSPPVDLVVADLDHPAEIPYGAIGGVPLPAMPNAELDGEQVVDLDKPHANMIIIPAEPAAFVKFLTDIGALEPWLGPDESVAGGYIPVGEFKDEMFPW